MNDKDAEGTGIFLGCRQTKTRIPDPLENDCELNLFPVDSGKEELFVPQSIHRFQSRCPVGGNSTRDHTYDHGNEKSKDRQF